MKKYVEDIKCAQINTTKKLFLLLIVVCSALMFLYSSSFLTDAFCDTSSSLQVFSQTSEQISEETKARLKQELLGELSAQSLTKSEETTEKNDQTILNTNHEDFQLFSIDCKINEDVTIQCLQSDAFKKDEVYLPFSFIKKYFDVTGELSQSDARIFNFKQSYGKVSIGY